MTSHHQVLIIGGGTAGIMVASQLLKNNSNLNIGLIDPADTHYYQPAWTLVGANTYDFDKTARSMSSIMPKGVKWIKEYADKFDPDNNKVIIQIQSIHGKLLRTLKEVQLYLHNLQHQ